MRTKQIEYHLERAAYFQSQLDTPPEGRAWRLSPEKLRKYIDRHTERASDLLADGLLRWSRRQRPGRENWPSAWQSVNGGLGSGYRRDGTPLSRGCKKRAGR